MPASLVMSVNRTLLGEGAVRAEATANNSVSVAPSCNDFAGNVLNLQLMGLVCFVLSLLADGTFPVVLRHQCCGLLPGMRGRADNESAPFRAQVSWRLQDSRLRLSLCLAEAAPFPIHTVHQRSRAANGLRPALFVCPARCPAVRAR